MEEERKNVKRTTALITAIVIPLLLFIFFYFLLSPTQEEVDRIQYPPKLFPLSVEMVEIDGVKKMDTIYHSIEPFTLTNQFGNDFTQQLLEGKYTVVDFFFTSCPTMCPKMSDQMHRIQQEFIKDDDVLLLSHTIDPLRDSVSVLKEYASNYEAVPGKWFFATGNREVIEKLAFEGYKLSLGSSPEDMSLHSQKFVLIDRQLNIRGYYDGTDVSDVNQLMADLVLLLEYE